ncbi:MAG: LicD family protein [Lachnospiraceae bacterium]|nr:LicD family protein [Lachnospiraceae bacterium]
MSETQDLRRIQLKELELLKEFVRICDKYRIPYFLIGGTLIGAVRHKGFIPWDDDIDVAVEREDYERLIGILDAELEHGFKAEHYSLTPGYTEYLMHITDPSEQITVTKIKNIESGIFIDILPIDGIPDGKIPFLLYKFNILKFRALAGLKNIDRIRDKKRSAAERLIIFIGRMIPIGRLLSLKKIRRETDRYVRRFRVSDHDKVGTIFGNYGFHEIVPKRMFGKGSKVIFEGCEFNAPELTHEYLTHMYGDYMTPPPENERKGHHLG